MIERGRFRKIPGIFSFGDKTDISDYGEADTSSPECHHPDNMVHTRQPCNSLQVQGFNCIWYRWLRPTAP